MIDRRLLEVLEERGDRPEVTRVVDHLVYFDERPPAEKAIRALRACGFEFLRDVGEAEGRFSIASHRAEACTSRDVTRFVKEILDIVLPLGGTCDGWGCEVQSARADSDRSGGL